MDYSNMSFDEKINQIEKVDVVLKPSLIKTIVSNSNRDDAIRIIKRYRENLRAVDYEILIKRKPTSDYAFEIIDIINDLVTDEKLIDLIAEIKDYDKRLEYFFKYFDRCDYWSLVSNAYRFAYRNSDEGIVNYDFIMKFCERSKDVWSMAFLIREAEEDKRIEFLKKYSHVLPSEEICEIIGSFKADEYDLKLKLYEEYKDKIEPKDIPIIVASVFSNSKEVINDFIERFKDIMPSDSTTYEKILDKNFHGLDLFEMIDKYIDKLDQSSISNMIKKNLSNFRTVRDSKTNEVLSYYIDRQRTQDRNYFADNIMKYNKYLDPYDIGKLIAKIEDNEEKLYNYMELIFRMNPQFKEVFSSLDDSAKERFTKAIMDLNQATLANVFSMLSKNHGVVDSEEKLYFVIKFVKKVMVSNSSEIRRISDEVLREIFKLPFERWEESFAQIEDSFLKNNIPYVGKIYDVFSTLHSDSKSYSAKAKSNNLKSFNSSKAVDIVLFSDLLRCAIGSNNRSLKNYLNNIKNGNIILNNIIDNQIDINLLDETERKILFQYLNYLNNLYNHTKAGLSNPRHMSNDIEKDSFELIQLFLKTESSNFDIDDLPDRIVSMFTHFVGIDKIDDLINCMNTELNLTNERNIQRARSNDFKLEPGDLIKGLSGQHGRNGVYLQYLSSILQNGNLCQEFLGSSSSKDATPLDADVSMIPDCSDPYLVFSNNSLTAASRYGPLWIVLKNDGKFNNTDINNTYSPAKLELFKTGVVGQDHFGIRTGFPSSAIDFFVMTDSSKLNVLKYEIVMNGFYIPVVDGRGELIFTPEEYNMLYQNMQGLSYYGTQNNYEFAPELDNFTLTGQEHNIDVDASINEVNNKRNQILNKLQSAGLYVILGRSYDLSDNSVELIDTGSTGRGTNKMNDYDFDFIMRVDRISYSNTEAMNKIYDAFRRAFPGIKFENNNAIRSQTVTLPDGTIAKIDVTFISKTDKLDYSTDECIKDRLSNIKRLDSDKYKKVLQNIVLAKEVLKDCYKPKHAGQGKAQGGLGGVGVENWILQSGGSFERAARIFLSYAEGRDFEEFKKVYTVWDFGENHMADMHSKYKHDEFVSNNMNQQGYDKMKEVLREYIRKLDDERTIEHTDETR